jgi:hypothetical protein
LLCRGEKGGEPGGEGDLLHCHLHHLLTHHSHTLPLYPHPPLAVVLEHRRNGHVGTAVAVVVSFYPSCTCTAVSACISAASTAALSVAAVLVVEVSDAAVGTILVFICDVVRDVTSGTFVADVDVVLADARAAVAVLVVVADLSIVAVDVILTVAVARSINSFEGVAVKT